MTEKNSTVESTKNEFSITRVFNAPRELVFKAFTQAEHLVHWWGPKGFKLTVNKLDFKPDGIFHYCMEAANGNQMWGKFIYREIVAPEKIVFTNSFSDKEGNIIRAPFSEIWPLEILNIWTLSENEGKTTVILKGNPINATPEEIKTFEAGYASMQQGFKGTFDQLEEYLVKM